LRIGTLEGRVLTGVEYKKAARRTPITNAQILIRVLVFRLWRGEESGVTEREGERQASEAGNWCVYLADLPCTAAP
jgi:hypothetical protein